VAEKGKVKGDAGAARSGEVILDFSGVRPFEPLDERDDKGNLMYYACEVTALRLGKAKKGGGPKASLELTVKSPGKYAKRKLFSEYSLQPQALPFLYEFIKAVDPDENLGEDFRFNPDRYIGLSCAVTVVNEKFEEQTRSRVKKIFAPGKANS